MSEPLQVLVGLLLAGGSALLALAYVAKVMLAVRRRILTGLQRRLAAVGQMAFTNYIMHSILCTFVFYGHGLGLFGQVERYQQLLIVFAVWALQLWLSPLWLARCRFGPLEWVWRTLTYGRLQPIRARASITAA